MRFLYGPRFAGFRSKVRPAERSKRLIAETMAAVKSTMRLIERSKELIRDVTKRV